MQNSERTTKENSERATYADPVVATVYTAHTENMDSSWHSNEYGHDMLQWQQQARVVGWFPLKLLFLEKHLRLYDGYCKAHATLNFPSMAAGRWVTRPIPWGTNTCNGHISMLRITYVYWTGHCSLNVHVHTYVHMSRMESNTTYSQQ